MNRAKSIAAYDPELWKAIADENQRQEEHIELIASENYASRCVMESQGSQLTNKYAEGYPHKRYYGGFGYVCKVEQLAICCACKLCKCEYVNVQPRAGSQVKTVAYLSFRTTSYTV